MSVDIAGQTTLSPLILPTNIATSDTSTTVTSTVVDLLGLTGPACGLFTHGGSAMTGTVVSQVLASQDPALNVNSIGADTTDVVLRNGAADNLTVGVKFTPTYNCTINECWIKLKSAGTIAGAKYIKLEIQTNNAGVPSNTVLATAATLDPSTVATAYSLVKFSFATPVDLVSTGVYHFVLSGDYAASSSNHIKIGTATVASAGTLSLYDASWAAVATQKPNLRATGYVWTETAGDTFTTAAEVTRVGFGSDGVGRYYRGKMVMTAADSSSAHLGSVSVEGTNQQG